MSTRRIITGSGDRRNLPPSLVIAVAAVAMLAAGFVTGVALHFAGSRHAKQAVELRTSPATDTAGSARSAAATELSPLPGGGAQTTYTVYLADSEQAAAAEQRELARFERKMDGEVATDELFVAAGTPDEWREARLLIKQLELDYGTTGVRVVDLRRPAGADATAAAAATTPAADHAVPTDAGQ
jgi:hypothetical protein